MKISVIKGEELNNKLIKKWLNIQKSEPMFNSPFFCPQFCTAVAEARNDVYVSVIEEHNEIVGFFPFQKDDEDIGSPVGAGMSDYQGIIIKMYTKWNATEILKASGLRSWYFDHLIRAQKEFELYFQIETESPIIELSRGYNAYESKRRKEGTKQILQIERRIRQIEKEVGQIDFEIHVNDFSLLHKLITWKSAQYKQTEEFDKFSLKWVVNLHEILQNIHEKDFSGLLSALYADGIPIALHMGMRSNTVWHWWTPAYDRSFSKYSPGLILLLKMVKVSESMGITVVDLGKVTYHYKKRLMNGAIPIAEGIIYLK